MKKLFIFIIIIIVILAVIGIKYYSYKAEYNNIVKEHSEYEEYNTFASFLIKVTPSIKKDGKISSET